MIFTMRLSTIVTAIIAVVGAFALAVVTQIINPSEKVNALWLVVAAACFFVISYRLYGSFLTAKVLALDDRRLTPAKRMADGRDYHPTHKWVLFGHHFAAIAGAGPLIGPVLATQFGYLPGFLWILIGAALGGAVHDTVILTASVRRNGRSLAQIAKDEVGPVAGITAALGILFIIIVALAGLGLAVVGAWAYLIYSGSISTIWPMFGVANQLLAALAFCVGTTVIIKMGKPRYAWVTFLPMLFMFIMTMTASYQLLWMFLGKAAHAATPGEAFAFRLDAVLVAAMAMLAIVVVVDSLAKWYGYLAGKRDVVTSEVVEWATDLEVR